jgi:hypothetical protein
MAQARNASSVFRPDDGEHRPGLLAKRRSPIIPITDAAAGLREIPDPEKQVLAQRELREILSALNDDKGTQDFALARARGHSRAEIKKQFNLTDTTYETALKRIQRAVQRRKSSGGQS